MIQPVQGANLARLNSLQRLIQGPKLHFKGADQFQPEIEGRKVMIVTDAWNQINGVATTVDNLMKELKKKNCEVSLIHPQLFKTLPTLYPGTDITNPIGLKGKVRKEIEAVKPDRIFIITEGPIGWAARNYCKKNNIPFSTNYTTKWPEYIRTVAPIPLSFTYNILKRFHNSAQSILVTTPSLLEDLQKRGFKNLVQWSRAVDTERFNLLSDAERQVFIEKQGLAHRKRPFYLYVGRVSAEKNIQAFLNADLPGTKIVVGPEGAGASLDTLKRQYPDTVFTGGKQGKELTDFYASSDVFIFPSKTDTFGLVLLEALASGLPVVGFNVTGPKDVIAQGSKVGFLAENDTELRQKAIQAWSNLQSGKITRKQCRNETLMFSWEVCVRKLLDNLKIHQWTDKS